MWFSYSLQLSDSTVRLLNSISCQWPRADYSTLAASSRPNLRPVGCWYRRKTLTLSPPLLSAQFLSYIVVVYYQSVHDDLYGRYFWRCQVNNIKFQLYIINAIHFYVYQYKFLAYNATVGQCFTTTKPAGKICVTLSNSEWLNLRIFVCRTVFSIPVMDAGYTRLRISSQFY